MSSYTIIDIAKNNYGKSHHSGRRMDSCQQCFKPLRQDHLSREKPKCDKCPVKGFGSAEYIAHVEPGPKAAARFFSTVSIPRKFLIGCLD